MSRQLELAKEYYDALKDLAGFLPLERLQREAERRYGLSSREAVEMAYDNMLMIAKQAIKGRRRPK